MRARLVLGILVMAAVAAATLLPSRAQQGQKWALVVGVDRYDKAHISPLRYAGADARAVARALREVGGFAADNVFVMTTSEGEAPTSENVLGKLEGLRAAVEPGDTFVFFFSGHGVEKDKERWLLTSDANTASVPLLRKTALGVKEVQEALRDIQASRILQLVDACANDPWSPGKDSAEGRLTEGLSRDLLLTARRSGGELEAAVTMFSCKVGQKSYESASRGQGYFTYYLVEGLRGKAAGPDGAVTVPSLVSYLSKTVPKAVQVHEYGKPQEPWADTQGPAMDWVLARAQPLAVVPQSAPVSAPPPAARPAPQPAPAPAAPPRVAVTSPSSGARTTRNSVMLGATVTGGGTIAEVTVTVNGQDVPLGRNALRKTAQGAMVSVAVPLEVGENTVMVMAVSQAGQPAQAAVTVERSAPPAPAAPRPQPADAPAAALPQPAAAQSAPRPQAQPTPDEVAINRPTSSEMTNTKDGSVLRYVAGGTFQMGSSDAVSTEKPPHSVTLPPYWIGKYEVTNAQYRRFVQATGHKSAGDWESKARDWGEQAPVVFVSWNDANAYCAWAGLRLPTEAEWELAARGTEGRKYPWGDTWEAALCRNSVGSSPGRPAAVGNFPSGASPYGCLDMAGNVWEWCSSKKKHYPYRSGDDREDPVGSDFRVLRGGSWLDYSDVRFRGAVRDSYHPAYANNGGGFRPARYL